MQKRLRKKHQTTLPVSALKMPAPRRWGWALAGLAVVIGCLMLGVFAISRNQAAPIAITTPRPVMRTSSPIASDGHPPATQQTTGVFPLSAGGPIPISATVLHPTTIAHVVIKNVFTSIYAGYLTKTPAIGALAILQENLVTGQQSLHLYQTAQPVGALTILTVQNGMLTLSTPKASGTFNLSTDQFHFSTV